MQGAPIFGKIELLLKKHKKNEDKDFPSTERLVFNDCGMVITGDYIIIVIKENDPVNSTSSSTGKIYNIGDVIEYVTHNQ